MKRVYHPTLPSWYDVPDNKVEDWEKQGWKSERPDGFQSEDEKLLPVGEGYVVPQTVGSASPTDGSEIPEPSGNASTDEWRGYALSQGATETDVEGLSRDELRSTYGTPATTK